MRIVRNRLFENPDNVLYNDGHDTYRYSYHDDRYKPMPFGFYKGELVIREGNTHGSIPAWQEIRDKLKSNSSNDYWDPRKILQYTGRLWRDPKIISFWQYPPKNKFKEIIDKIGKGIGQPNMFNDPEWKIEIITNEKDYDDDNNVKLKAIDNPVEVEDDDWENGEYITEIIPLKNYVGSGQRSKQELAQQHTVSPMDKNKTRRPDKSAFFKIRDKKEKPLAWKQAMYAESLMEFDTSVIEEFNKFAEEVYRILLEKGIPEEKVLDMSEDDAFQDDMDIYVGEISPEEYVKMVLNRWSNVPRYDNRGLQEALNEKLLIGEPPSISELRDLLAKKVINFEFIKLNGEVRPAKGTVLFKYIPKDQQPTGENPSSDKVAAFYDLSKGEWRSVSNRSDEIVIKKDPETGKPKIVVSDKKPKEEPTKPSMPKEKDVEQRPIKPTPKPVVSPSIRPDEIPPLPSPDEIEEPEEETPLNIEDPNARADEVEPEEIISAEPEVPQIEEPEDEEPSQDYEEKKDVSSSSVSKEDITFPPSEEDITFPEEEEETKE